MANYAFVLWLGMIIGAILTSDRTSMAENVGICFASLPVVALLALF